MVSRSERGLVAEWWRTIDRGLLTAFLALLALGMVMSFAASPPVAERIGLDTFHFTERHAVFAVLAAIVMLVTSYLNGRQARRLSLVLLAGSIVAMILALAIGVEIKGSRRWISVAGFSLQPSEFMKPAFVVICAWLFARGGRGSELPGNLFAAVLMISVGVLLLAQPDLGQTMLTLAVWGMMFFMAGMPWLWIAMLAALGIGGMGLAYTMLPHVTKRIDRFLTGEGDNFQVDTATEAIVSGGWLGKGPGEGTMKGILPDSHTDFVFAVLGEEFGIALALVVVAIFALIVMRGLVAGFRERDEFTRLAASGLAMLIGFQALINIGVNLRLLPAKGMTLPFVSSGGSSMLAVAITAGLLLALTRTRPDHRESRRRYETFEPTELSFSRGARR